MGVLRGYDQYLHLNFLLLVTKTNEIEIYRNLNSMCFTMLLTTIICLTIQEPRKTTRLH